MITFDYWEDPIEALDYNVLLDQGFDQDELEYQLGDGWSLHLVPIQTRLEQHLER